MSAAIQKRIDLRKSQLEQLDDDVIVELTVSNTQEVKFKTIISASQARELLKREISELERIIQVKG